MFHNLRFTRHAEVRMRQRGFRESDIGLIFSAATRVADDAFHLTNKDVAREIAQRRREIQNLERLRGTKMIVEGGGLITLYNFDGRPSRAAGRNWRRSE